MNTATALPSPKFLAYCEAIRPKAATVCYLAGYRKGECALQTGSVPDQEMTSEVEALINNHCEEGWFFDTVTFGDLCSAWLDGISDGFEGRDPLTSEQIEMHYD